MKKLILASKSPRRFQLLKENGFNFMSIPADIDEESYENRKPIEMVEILSKLKAEKISKIYPKHVILGADTTIDLNGKIISKPKDLTHAKKMLKELSGSTHLVITGFTIINNKEILIDHEITQVIFKDLTDMQIENYINSVNVLELAGSYAIQEGADVFVKEIKGDYNNVVGLPTETIRKLKKILK